MIDAKRRTIFQKIHTYAWPAVVRHWPLALTLLLALALRIALWGNLPREGLISDEAEYLAAAEWLAQGRGFTWHQGWLWTRAPLYPLFLAVHIRLFGLNLTPIYVSQTLLSLVNVALVYMLAQLVLAQQPTTTNQTMRPAVGASLLMALYLPFATYPQILLSETLYLTLLLGAFVCLGAWATIDRRPTAASHGGKGNPPQFKAGALCLGGAGLLGLATLTRGLTLGFLPIVLFWICAFQFRRTPFRIQSLRSNIVYAGLFVACVAGTILPWSVYASQTYGGTTLVDTTGAYNLLLGARTAYDGRRQDAPPRNFALALLDRQLSPEARESLVDDTCLYEQRDPRLQAALAQEASQITQGQRQQLMVAEGLCLLQARPDAFVLKSLRELVDLFQINYTGAERMTGGFSLGRLPPWYTLVLFLLDDTLYVLMLPLAIIGWALIRTPDLHRQPSEGSPHADQDSPNRHPRIAHLIGLWWLYNLATAPLLFAINRFRLPLLPFAFIFAAYALTVLPGGGWRRLRSRYGLTCVALAILLTLIAATPYAYLEPVQPGQNAQWSSYLGPRPSSLDSTITAWEARTDYLATQTLQAAMQQNDAQAARAVLTTGDVPTYTQAIAFPLIAGLEGDPASGLTLLDQQSINPLHRWQTAVVRGDLLRQIGEWDSARAVFSPTYVDDHNPVEWAWQWLSPPPLPNNRIDLGGDLDLGYIRGFYLGEGAPDIEGTVRWSGPVAQMRFPAAGSGADQQFCMRADGRGWPTGLPQPHTRLLLREQPVATIALQRNDVQVYCAPLPATQPGADIVVTLRTDTFVPEAADLLGQQGALVGQLRLLGVRLDWAEIR